MASEPSNLMVSEAHLVSDEARRRKAERIKTFGDPIQLSGKALSIRVHASYAWIAENTAVARKVDLESGKTVQLFKGHTGPVTTLAFCDKELGSGDGKVLITGSWDKTIKLWDIDTKEMLSSTPEAHSDFVKSLLVLPSLRLLVSSGSDKIVRFWDLSRPCQNQPLQNMGSITSHTRPVECIDGKSLSSSSAFLYTADTMGVIKSWILMKEDGATPRWRETLQHELTHHRTRINEMLYDDGYLWTASSDETTQVLSRDPETHHPKKPIQSISHPVAVRCILPLLSTEVGEPYLITGAGDVLRVYDVSNLEEPELVKVVDAHWHDVTAVRFWKRTTKGDDGRTRTEPWIISTSLDGTIRRWQLRSLLSSVPNERTEELPHLIPAGENTTFQMTEDEESELAELMGAN